MATAADIRRRVRDYVYSNQLPERPFVHQINGAINNSVTAIVVDNGTFFATGDIIEFWDEGEQCYVISVATNTLTVIRGWNGTTANSQADNAVIVKNPRFSQRQMDEAVDGVLRQLEGGGIHVWGGGTIVRVSQQETYDLADTDILGEIGVVSVFHEDAVTIAPVPLPFIFHRYPTALATQGYALRLWEWGDTGIGESVNYVYAKQIDSVTDLLPRQEELVVLGAVGQLLGGTMAPRTHDPGKLTDQGVQPGQGGRDGRWFQAEFYVRSRAEQALLKDEIKRFPQNRHTARAKRWRW